MLLSAMTLPTTEQIAQLTHAELVALVTELIRAVPRLAAENPATQGRVGQSPAPAIPELFAAAIPGGEAQPGGAACAQETWAAVWACATDTGVGGEPDRIIEAPVESCGHCQADLRGIEPRAVLRHPLTELPPITPVVMETRQAEVVCPECQQITRGALPAGLDSGRSFGPRLAATGVYLNHAQPLSYERVTQLCQALFGVAVSEGGASALMQRAGVAAQPGAPTISEQVAQSAVIGSDETSARGAGRTWWQWVGRSAGGGIFSSGRVAGRKALTR